MSQNLLRLLLAIVISTAAGCAGRDSKPKSSVHLHAGEGPTVRYSDQPEAAGGPLNPY